MKLRKITVPFSKIKERLKFRKKERAEAVFETPSTAVSEFPLIETKTKHKFLAAAAYLCLLVLLPLFFGRESQFIRFHTGQGLLLLAVWSLGFFLFFLPPAGYFVYFLALILALIGLVNVFRSKSEPLPIVGKISLL